MPHLDINLKKNRERSVFYFKFFEYFFTMRRYRIIPSVMIDGNWKAKNRKVGWIIGVPYT